MTDLSDTDFRRRFLRLEQMVLPGDRAGTREITFDSNLPIDAATTLALEEAGAHVVDTTAVNFTGPVDVTADGDGSATVDVTAATTDTNTHVAVSQDAVQVLADVADLNLTGSAVDSVVDDGDGSVTATLVNTDTDTHTGVSSNGASVLADVADINFEGAVSVADDADGSVTATVTDTHTAVSEDGTELVADAVDINFGSGVSATADGDGSVTVTADQDTTVNTQQFPVSQIADADSAVFRLAVPTGMSLTVHRGGVQDDTGAVPAGLDLRVYDETGAAAVQTFTSTYNDPADASVAGAVDVRIELRNATGASVNASGWVEYTIA